MSLVTDTNPGGFDTNPDDMIVSRSKDHGATWEDPVSLNLDEGQNSFNDKNAITAGSQRLRPRVRGVGSGCFAAEWEPEPAGFRELGGLHRRSPVRHRSLEPGVYFVPAT
jgi:hypothetical protein